jgi:peptidoglycan/xylan/chitin deacetylase (PgdA/CDA1 family)
MSVYASRGPAVRVLYLLIAFLYWPVAMIRRRRVTLCYHGVLPRQRTEFARQMRWLARRGTDRVRLTFDDAFANLLDNALPVLTELNIPVTIFAVTGNLGSRPAWDIAPDHPDASEVTMTAAQMRLAAAECPVTFGTHGVTHRRLTELPDDEAHRELVESKRDLEWILDTTIHDFAAPHGACDEALIASALTAGYRRVHVTEEPPRKSAQRAEGHVIGRMKMSPDAWPIEFELTAFGAYGWLPGFRKLVRMFRPGGTGPERRRRRILAVASGGGHWVQLLRLRPALAGEHVVWATVNKAYRTDVGTAPFHVVNDATRWNRLALLKLAVRMAWLVLRVRPDVVVTTGAAPGYFAVLFGKLLGARTAWIDSMANAEALSLAGRKIGPWADLWLTQWPELARAQGPHYQGAVL